ncbi:MAG: HEAT repeat domain-containing protein [Candidatus Harrisonbacteria bacterium]|nr:HEAT repeat domain-containing protein [Candidatus Harrisonbacteria bacterium]
MTKTASLNQLIETIAESIQFSYERRLSTGEEFIINFPGQALRWIAFEVEGLEWKLYEKNGNNLKSFRLFEADRETMARGGNIDLTKIEVETTPGQRQPLAKFLNPPSFMPAQDAIFPEAGGFVLKDEAGKLAVMPFPKKGIAPISENGMARGVGFFVHPGGIPILESKDKGLSIPFSASEYDVLYAQNSKATFVLGWHTTLGGPAKLHPVEEKEMASRGIGGMHLVVTPEKLALWDYSGVAKQKAPRLVFESETSNVNAWKLKLTTHLNKQIYNDSPSSGYQLRDAEKDLLEEALERGEKTQPRNIKQQIQKIYFDLTTSYGLEVPGLEAFIEHSDFKFVIVKPEGQRGERAPPMGLGVKLGRPGRDLYATFDIAPKEMENGFEVTIFVGHGIYELAGEKERLEIIAHEFYQAYRIAYQENPRTYPLDIDLELKLDEEIRRAQGWESRIPLEEKEDLGLTGGIENRTDSHVRSRAFARLVGAPSSDGIGTRYTHLLRHVYALSKRFAQETPRARDPLNVIPPPAQDAFRYAQNSFENVVSGEGLQRLFEMSAYIHENKEEELTEFLEKKIEEGKNLLLLNQNAPTPWILKDTRKIIEDLAADGKLKQIFVDLPPQLQPQIDQYLETGRSSQELLTAIASRFPSFLPREFQRPDLYENLLQAVYEHNLEAGNGGKIRVTAYYQGRQLPPMPQHGNFPPRPGDMPFRQPGERPFQAPPGFGERGAQPPIMPRPGELPFPPGLPLPQLPLTQGVKEAFQRALSEAERNRSSAVLFLKPLDEFFPEELSNHPGVASILHIDKYTGYGPEKPENQLALYMSEQASPNQKSFALPILAEAPFYEESVNPGVPRGLRFNEFNVYPDLILSTAGDGDDSLEPTPDEVVPEEIGPLVPVGGGGRSELRLVSPNAVPALNQRDTALKELIQIGEPAVGPLVNVLALPSVTLRLGAIQALGVIGDPRAIGPLNQVAQVAELREAAKLAVQSIQADPRTLNEAAMSRKENAGKKVKHSSFEMPSSVQGVYEPLTNLDSQKSVSVIQTLLKQTSLVVDLDVESLMRKDNNGRISLSGWGFTEVLKTLETELPDEFFERIRIRLVNLNPQIRPEEIERAFGITPELRRIVEIINVPVRHTAFKGIEAFLEKDALKIASERNQSLWNNNADILVKEPGKGELIDGRKLFLAALLHRALRSKISKELKAAVIRLLRQISDLPVNGMSYFNADSRNGFSLEFLNEMERVNRMLASMA